MKIRLRYNFFLSNLFIYKSSSNFLHFCVKTLNFLFTFSYWGFIFLGSPTGRVFSARMITVIPGDVGSPVEPISTAKDFQWTAEDSEKVKELRKWWRVEQRRKGITGLNGVSQTLEATLSTMQIDLPLDLYCKILEIRREEIVITDGTECPHLLLSFDGNFKNNMKTITIFMKDVTDNNLKNSNIRVGDFIVLKDIECIPEGNGFKLVSDFDKNNMIPLAVGHSKIKEIDKRLNPDQYGVSDSQQLRLGDDTLNSILEPMNSQDWVTNSNSLSQQTNTKNNTSCTLYPSNMDEILLQPSPSLVTASQGTSRSSLTQNSKNNDEEIQHSQEFYTAPQEERERLSPSPERDQATVVYTKSDYGPWTSVSELNENMDDTINAFRIQGYVRNVSDDRKKWKQSLCVVCNNCCEVGKYEQSSRKLKCPKCQKNREIAFHFTLEIEEFSPRHLSQHSPKLKLFLAGHHANKLLDETADNFVQSPEVRKNVHEKMEYLLNKLVTISILRMWNNDDSEKNCAYQIVDSYFMDPANM